MAKNLSVSRAEIQVYSKNLEKEVAVKTEELNKALDSAQGDKNDLERQRLATLNILEDISESKGELEELNQRLEARGSELAALKDLSDDLTSVLDVEEVVVIANSYFDKLISFSTINYLIINSAHEGIVIGAEQSVIGNPAQMGEQSLSQHQITQLSRNAAPRQPPVCGHPPAIFRGSC